MSRNYRIIVFSKALGGIPAHRMAGILLTLPFSSKAIAFGSDFSKGEEFIVVEHPSFSKVDEGACIPRLRIVSDGDNYYLEDEGKE